MVTDDLKERLATANAQLKAANFRLQIEIRGRVSPSFSLRGTFPPKPGQARRQPYQQRIALGIPASRDTLKIAVQQAKLIGRDLAIGEFDWRKFSDHYEASPQTAQDWVKRCREYWEATREQNRHSEESWRCRYAVPYSRLPNEPLSKDLILDWIRRTAPGTPIRGHYCTAARLLCKVAGLELEQEIKDLARGSGSLKPVNPRDLPTDDKLLDLGEAIKQPAWRQVYWILLCYGLRPHEVFGLDWQRFPVVRTHSETKTGARAVVPCLFEWHSRIDRDSLALLRHDPSVPRNGHPITCWFRDNGVGITPYVLRHCYRRRLTEKGTPPDVAARLMGHSQAVSELVYQAWISEEIWVDRAMSYVQQ